MFMNSISRGNLFIVVCTFVSIAMGLGACTPRADWVSGAAPVTVTKVTFTGQQRIAECTSVEIIDYLNKCLAQRRAIHDEKSLPYSCTVVTSDGTTFVINAMIGFHGMMGLRTSEAEDYIYGVDKLAPIPPSYTALLDFLLDSRQKPGVVAKF